jgi:UDP:flavonoid glycosyltransferase YjiC (YdhE family)
VRIAVFTLGTQGDWRPFAALGQALVRHGHSVRLTTGANFAAATRAAGLDDATLTGDFQDMMRREQGAVAGGMRPLLMARTMRRVLKEMAAHWAEEGLAAARDADLVIGSGSVTRLAASIAEARGLPFVQAHLQPMTPTREITPMLPRPPRRPLPGFANRALFTALRLVGWQVIRPAIDGVVRPRLGLRPYPWYGPYQGYNPAQERVIYGFSRHLIPAPSDWPAETTRVTGFWFLDEAQGYAPPPRLARFLAAGPPGGPKPIYVGFGSMLSERPDALTATILAAVRASGRRVVLSTGWGGLSETTALPEGLTEDDAIVVGQVPHDWLFPRMAMAVHHGGAGTTAAACRAGIPSVVIPFFFGDQPFWADRMQRLGVAPPRLAHARLTAQGLAAAIAAASAPAMVRAAADLGARIRAEDGTGTAIAQLTEWNCLGTPRLRAA